MRRNVYDFEDFLEVLNVHGRAILMKSGDFNVPRAVSYQSKFTEGKPLLDDISVAMFNRGSTKLFWKENFEDGFKSAEFLQKKIADSLFIKPFCLFILLEHQESRYHGKRIV